MFNVCVYETCVCETFSCETYVYESQIYESAWATCVYETCCDGCGACHQLENMENTKTLYTLTRENKFICAQNASWLYEIYESSYEPCEIYWICMSSWPP